MSRLDVPPPPPHQGSSGPSVSNMWSYYFWVNSNPSLTRTGVEEPEKDESQRWTREGEEGDSRADYEKRARYDTIIN